MVANRKPAEDGVAEEAAAKMASRRHHPAHAEQGAKLLGVAGAVRAGADHFLQRDDVGLDRPDHFRNTRGHRPAVEAAAAVDVVGGDPDCANHAGLSPEPSKCSV